MHWVSPGIEQREGVAGRCAAEGEANRRAARQRGRRETAAEGLDVRDPQLDAGLGIGGRPDVRNRDQQDSAAGPVAEAQVHVPVLLHALERSVVSVDVEVAGLEELQLVDVEGDRAVEVATRNLGVHDDDHLFLFSSSRPLFMRSRASAPTSS